MINKKIENALEQLRKYNLLDENLSTEELSKWVLQLNDLELNNFLSLNINPENIKFSKHLLIDKDLLNTLDYTKRVEALVSIKNADGFYHLFDYMLRKEFLNSDKFYQDIETLKKAKCAQTPLWIIGDEVFINSPYHDEDFHLLVTAKDTSGRNLDELVWEAIAKVASNISSINSGYHRQDLQTIIKYGSKALQSSNAYPESSINKLATNSVSLNDIYHLQNMEILAQNTEIGNFLYAVMTDCDAILNKNYRAIIREMVENKNSIGYVFLVCCYAIGKDKAKQAQDIYERNFLNELYKDYNIDEAIKRIDEKFNIIDGNFKDITMYELECNQKRKKLISDFLEKIINKIK